MKIVCPHCSSIRLQLASEVPTSSVRIGYYFRKSDSQRVPRRLCLVCKRSFSSGTTSLRRNQKARRITAELEKLICARVSLRRAAIILGVNRKTVVRRFRYLAEIGRRSQAAYLREIRAHGPIQQIQFDDLETIEHTKCKPLSVVLAVEPRTRKILSFHVSRMPAKGQLAQIARRKYGTRRDERGKGWEKLFLDLKSLADPCAQILSDDNPHYPKFVKRHFPRASHKTVLGGRGAVAGQGELRKKRFDPMFSLNHTCAMLRGNLNRLIRRTWCTTKSPQGLIDHLSIYVAYHNRRLTPPYTR